MKVLVTGASGFVGRVVVAKLLSKSIEVRASVRSDTATVPPFIGVEFVGLSGSGFVAADWINAVNGCSVVIHLAARAHVVGDAFEDQEAAFHSANVQFTHACAVAAKRAGVRRFIFISSAGVYGRTSGTKPFHLGSDLAPHTPYARSKAKAESVLVEVVHGSSMELTIIRSPLVYGLGAPGNFGALMHAVKNRWPLPFGMVTCNRRSFVAIDNLVDLIMTCLDHPAASNQTFLVSDGEDLSTRDLVCLLGATMGQSSRLLPIPVGVLALGATLIGKSEMYHSLCDSLQLDISKTRELLGWCPPIGVDEGLKRATGSQQC